MERASTAAGGVDVSDDGVSRWEARTPDGTVVGFAEYVLDGDVVARTPWSTPRTVGGGSPARWPSGPWATPARRGAPRG